MIKLRVTGQQDAAQLVERFAQATGRDLADELVATARLLAVSLAHSTQPYGNGQAARQAGEQRVEQDIRKVFLTPSGVYQALVSDDSPGEARGFWAALRAGDEGRMRAIMEANAISVEIGVQPDPALHQASRNRRGRVKGAPKMLVTRPPVLSAYIARVKKRVGFAKAGWAKAADDCGGHRGIPAWASGRHSSAPGGALIDRSPVHPAVILRNEVGYIRDVLPDSQVQTAVGIAYEKLLKRLNIILRKRAAAARRAA